MASKAVVNSTLASKARLSMQKVSPVRFRQVADLVRGKSLEDANRQLLMSSKVKAAKLMLKLLRSAMANAQQKGTADLDRLFISSLMVNEGPRIKHFFPRAQGRADVRLTRTSHVVLELSEKTGSAPKAAAKKAGSKSKTKKTAKAGE